MIKLLKNFYSRLTPRERMIFYGVLLILVILFVDRLVLGPVMQKMKFLEGQTQDEEIAIKKSLHILLRKPQIEAESKMFQAYSLEAKNPEEEMTALLKEIENIANQSGASLMYLKPGTATEDKNIKKYSASVELEAEMKSVTSFFYTVENSKKLLQIEKYNIQPKNRESSIARCTATISKTVLS